jgi:tetratricopeptide (TPR) repeat protein
MVVKNALARALALHTQGQLAAAEKLYHEVLQSHPNAFPAIEGLGALAFQQGRANEAAMLFARGLVIRPQSARTHANLGEALRFMGRLDLAVPHLRQATELDPALAEAFNSLGMVAFDQGNRDEAEAAYREAIRLAPRLAAARINLANVHHARRLETEATAELRLALEIEPENPIALAILGQVLCSIGDPDLLGEAEALCRRAATLAPQFPQALESLGNVLRARKAYPEALDCYERAAKLGPDRGMPYHYMGEYLQQRGEYAEAARFYAWARAKEPKEARFHADLGSLAAARGLHEEAARHYRTALECNSRVAEYHLGLGLAILELGRLDEAASIFGEALSIDPFLTAASCALARLQAERGDFDLSCRSARAALAIRPGLPDAYWRLASNLKGDLPEADDQAIEGLIEDKSLNDGERAFLHFGLAFVFDARGLYSRAAALLEKANALQSSAKAARGELDDGDRHSRFIDRTIAAFTPGVIARGRAWGDPDPRPVFVVGLPRTGTSLVEQILASHSQVHGAGELHEMDRVFGDLPHLLGQASADPFDALGALDPDSAKSVAKIYLDMLGALAPSTAARVVDKMPDNIRHLGLISLILPEARVIVCNRDLRDVALSCWQTGFEKNPWANNWDNIARRFADHQRLVDHWQRVLPTGSLMIRYEHLVHNLEKYAHVLIDYLGLEWHPACLEFHKTRRVVRTASLVQVRQPLYTNSVGRWRQYESSLQPLLQAFRRRGVRLEEELGPE